MLCLRVYMSLSRYGCARAILGSDSWLELLKPKCRCAAVRCPGSITRVRIYISGYRFVGVLWNGMELGM